MITREDQKKIGKVKRFLKKKKEDLGLIIEGKENEAQYRIYNRMVKDCMGEGEPDDRDEVRKKVAFILSDVRNQRKLKSGDPAKKQEVYDLMTPVELDCYWNDETNGARFCDIEGKQKMPGPMKVYRMIRKGV